MVPSEKIQETIQKYLPRSYRLHYRPKSWISWSISEPRRIASMLGKNAATGRVSLFIPPCAGWSTGTGVRILTRGGRYRAVALEEKGRGM